jgi:hypothetical protein
MAGVAGYIVVADTTIEELASVQGKAVPLGESETCGPPRAGWSTTKEWIGKMNETMKNSTNPEFARNFFREFHKCLQLSRNIIIFSRILSNSGRMSSKFSLIIIEWKNTNKQKKIV